MDELETADSFTPCRTCSHQPYLERYGEHNVGFVCAGCGVRTAVVGSIREAAKMWNLHQKSKA